MTEVGNLHKLLLLAIIETMFWLLFSYFCAAHATTGIDSVASVFTYKIDQLTNTSKQETNETKTFHGTNQILNARSAISSATMNDNNDGLTLMSEDTFDNKSQTVPWDKYIALIIKLSTEQLVRVQRNIVQYYKLSKPEVKELDAVFSKSPQDYSYLLQINLKNIVQDNKFNSSEEFMIDFMDLSNSIISKVVKYNLSKLKGKMLQPTKWPPQTLRDKIQRQQMKIVSNDIADQVCSILDVCVSKSQYSNFLIDWTRKILGGTSRNLKQFFTVILVKLDVHRHKIKSNLGFKQTIKYIRNSNSAVQRDAIDFIDEVLTNSENVFDILPEDLKKGATVWLDLIKNIDEEYDVNEDNEDQLDFITVKLNKWLAGEEDAATVVEGIIANFLLNFQIWPLDKQNKISQIWSELITLKNFLF